MGDTTEIDGAVFLRRYLGSLWELARDGVDALREWETEDVRGRFPWGDANVPEWSNVEEHAAVLALMPRHLSAYEMGEVAIRALQEPGRYVMEGSSTGTLKDGSGVLWNGWVSFVTLRDGKVADIREYGTTRRQRD